MNDLNYIIYPIYNYTSNFSIEVLYIDYYYKIYLNNNPIEMVIFFKDTAIDYLNRKQSLFFLLNYLYKDIDYEFKRVSRNFTFKIII